MPTVLELEMAVEELRGIPFDLEILLGKTRPHLTPAERRQRLFLAPDQRTPSRNHTAFRAAMARNLRAALGILHRRPDLLHIGAHPWDDPSAAKWHLVWTQSKEEQQ